MSVGETIRKYRKQKGLTQKELGELLGRTQRTIQAYEKGEVVPPLNILEKFADILGIGIHALIQGNSLEEKLESIKNTPPYDEYELMEFAKDLDVDYSNLSKKGKDQIDELYHLIRAIHKNYIMLTETDEFIHDYSENLSFYDIETIYKEKIKNLKDEKKYFEDKLKNLEVINKNQEEIIKLQRERIEDLNSSIDKIAEAIKPKEGELDG